MLCMSKMSKMGKEHTHTFWLITSLILNGFSIRKKFWKAETQILCMLKIIFDIFNMLKCTQCLMVWLESPKSQLSKTFFGLKIH